MQSRVGLSAQTKAQTDCCFQKLPQSPAYRHLDIKSLFPHKPCLNDKLMSVHQEYKLYGSLMQPPHPIGILKLNLYGSKPARHIFKPDTITTPQDQTPTLTYFAKAKITSSSPLPSSQKLRCNRQIKIILEQKNGVIEISVSSALLG